MKKKHNSTVKNLLTALALMFSLVILTGCTTLSYVGEDFNKENSANIQTNELFTFSTYKKTSEEGIDLKAGISRTPLPDALVVYIGIKNLSDTSDYIFYVKDLTIKAGNETLSPIPPSAYLDAYQRYETGTYAGLSNLAPTLGSFANIQNAYYNNTTSQADIAKDTGSTMTTQIGAIAKGISNHTITSAAVIPAGRSTFFYVFLKDPEFLPIDIFYKDLKYSFGKVKE